MNRAPWRDKLYTIIFESDTKAGKSFDVVLLWAILFSVLCVLLESDQSIGREYSHILLPAEWVFTVLFSIEFIARLLCARSAKKYAVSFFGLVDLISLAPTYISLLLPGVHFLVVIRAIRLLRVFRILKLVRYLQESKVLMSALSASRIKITIFIGAVLTIVLIMGTLMHMVESSNPGFDSIFKGMYWAIVTMTTVGFGDAVPITPLGKFIASVIMLMGYGIIAVPTGIVSAEIAAATPEGESPKNVCPSCSKELLSGAKFCHHCGVSLPSVG